MSDVEIAHEMYSNIDEDTERSFDPDSRTAQIHIKPVSAAFDELVDVTTEGFSVTTTEKRYRMSGSEASQGAGWLLLFAGVYDAETYDPEKHFFPPLHPELSFDYHLVVTDKRGDLIGTNADRNQRRMEIREPAQLAGDGRHQGGKR